MKALLFDTETNGLHRYDRRADHPGQPRMVAIAACILDEEGKLISMMNHLISPIGDEENWNPAHILQAKGVSANDGNNPKDPGLSLGAFAVNGLTWDRLVSEGIPVKSVMEKLNEMIDACDGVTAYNVDFDQKVQRGEFRRAGMPDRYGDRPIFCLMRASAVLCKMAPTDAQMAAGYKTNKNPKLSEAMQILLGKSLDGAHDAKNDMAGTIALYRHLLAGGHVQWKEQVSKEKSDA